MTVQTLIHCDGPECKRTIDLSIHANTWWEITTQIRMRGDKETKHYCSPFCIQKWIHKV